MCIGMANGGKTPKEVTPQEAIIIDYENLYKTVIKVLECCASGKNYEECSLNYESPTSRDILNLFKQQQSAIDVYMQENDRLKTAYIQVSMDRDEAKAEIERLQNESIGNCELAISMRNDNNLKGDCSYCVDKAKTEAIKECLEKIEQMDVSESDDYIMVKKYNFDNILEEMVGKKDGHNDK